jgi:hypothetical protein
MLHRLGKSSGGDSTYNIVVNGSGARVLGLGSSFACCCLLALVPVDTRGVGDRVRHEAGLVLALPVGTVVAPLFQSVSNCTSFKMMGRQSYVDTADAGVAAEAIEAVSLAAGTVALQHGLGLAAMNTAGDSRVGSRDLLGATHAVGELVQLVLGEVLRRLPLLADIASDPASFVRSRPSRPQLPSLLGREVGEVPPDEGLVVSNLSRCVCESMDQT